MLARSRLKNITFEWRFRFSSKFYELFVEDNAFVLIFRDSLSNFVFKVRERYFHGQYFLIVGQYFRPISKFTWFWGNKSIISSNLDEREIKHLKDFWHTSSFSLKLSNFESFRTVFFRHTRSMFSSSWLTLFFAVKVLVIFSSCQSLRRNEENYWIF